MLKEYDIQVNRKTYKMLIKKQEANRFVISTDGRDLHVSFDNPPSFGKTFAMEVESTKHEVSLSAPRSDGEVDVIVAGRHFKTLFTSERELKPVSPTIVEEPKIEETREAGVVYAPMSGSIKSIAAQIGQTVHAGQALLILEAMKMENEITAPRNGTVKQIHVSEGAKVSKNEPLITLA
jgi:biotin carboxyl carrier protein